MGSGFKDWTAGDVLTAADVDGYLMRQTVMTFADSSARDTALSGVLDEGMMAYLEDTNVTTYYNGSSWEDIRGLGGGSATNPGGFSSGDVLDAADLNALPGGRLDSTTAGDTTIDSSGVDIASITFTSTSRRVLILASSGRIDAASTALTLTTEIYTGANRTGTRILSSSYAIGASSVQPFTLIAERYPSGTVTLYWNAITNTGTCALNEGFGRLNQFAAYDMGPT